MKYALQHVWCSFVAWLVRLTFNVDLPDVIDARTLLVKERLFLDTLRVRYHALRESERKWKKLTEHEARHASATKLYARKYREGLDGVLRTKSLASARVVARNALQEIAHVAP